MSSFITPYSSTPGSVRHRSRRMGAALVIVLAFVVLLTGLVVAYFARSITARQLSNSSAGQAKSALLARSASDYVISGLKQEIYAGSVSPSPTPTSFSYCVPTTAAYAVPVRFGTPAPISSPIASTDAIPNLVRRSVRGDNGLGPNPSAIPTPAVPSLASAVSSNDPAINGHSISGQRWNSHYLIPRASTTADNDSTPDSALNFVAPDWVMMTRGGPEYEADVKTNAINNPSPTNQHYVIGRYAYAIYDEGGLLDMNVAGHPGLPNPTPAPVPTGTIPPGGTPPYSLPFTSTQIGQKGSLAMADLTQLSVPNTTNATPTTDVAAAPLAQSTIDSVVAWRNYASANLASPSSAPVAFPFPSPAFSTSQMANWFGDFACKNTTGFLEVYGLSNGTSTPQATDQAFLSRQQLLQLRNSINATTAAGNPWLFPASALQYMGTFSRGLEQPSYVPPHILYPPTPAANPASGAPDINAVGNTKPPLAFGPEDGYLGNNDAAGYQGSVSGQDIVNPSFLTVRVLNPFLRADLKQTPALVGDPLVKKKFALSRLDEMHFDASDSTASRTDPNFTALPNNPSAKNHIFDWFGLKRANTYDPWTYDHTHASVTTTTSTGTPPSILSLQAVAALSGSDARDPDFAELLKAAINAGSLGKGGPNLPHGDFNYQYLLDSSVDYQVLQIMANLIDQYDTDSYPTCIQIAAGTIMRTFRGVEDLPYFYRYHPFSVVTRLPKPLIPATSKVDFRPTPSTGIPTTRPPEPNAPVTTMSNCMAGPSSALTDPGLAVLLYAPDVWNPHDAGSALSAVAVANSSGPRPSQFRLTVVTQDPVGQTIVWNTGAQIGFNGAYGNPSIIPPKASIPAVTKPLATEDATAFTFTDNNGKLFREPTLLWRQDAPTGSSLAPAPPTPPSSTASLAGPWPDANTGVPYIGVQIGQSPVSVTGQIDPSQYYGTIPGTGNATTQPALASTDGNYIFQANGGLAPIVGPIAGTIPQYTFRLEYLDPNGSGKWIIYDEKYPDIHGIYPPPQLVVDTADYTNSQWLNSYNINQIKGVASGYDPRTPRFGIGTQVNQEDSGSPMLEGYAASGYQGGSSTVNLLFSKAKFTILTTQRPALDRGNEVFYSNPGMTSDPGKNVQMRWFSGVGWSATNNQNASPNEYDGLLSQNNPYLNILARDGATISQIYYEDPDGMARRAMGAYATSSVNSTTSGLLPTSKTSGATAVANYDGLPLITATTYPTTLTGPYGVGTPGTTSPSAPLQSLSRPIVLNRPFRSVAEMSYASSGGVWKQLDFFTPESGDSALLDTFCVNETLPGGLVAGKVNLNTHQKPVLQAIVAGATRDELYNLASRPSYANTMVPLSNAEALNVATTLQTITMDTTDVWRGPLVNIADLVGHYVNSSSVPTTGSNVLGSEVYSYTEPVATPHRQFNYAGLSGALDSAYITVPSQTNKIQRMRESAIRALSDSGQTRVWNLMIDVVAQTGRYTPNATSLAQFAVDGESRYWVHVAIDRFTGEVIDKQIELVSQ